MTGFLVIALTVSAFFPPLAYASGAAPNGPGAALHWAPSTNTIVGTAANTTSQVWFTGFNGVLTETFFPTADYANSTLLGFLVGDNGHTWVDEEQSATNSATVLYDPRSLAWSVTNTAKSGKYQISKTIYTDPSRNSIIQQVTFTALVGTLSDYLLYVY
jgi:glucoamylase